VVEKITQRRKQSTSTVTGSGVLSYTQYINKECTTWDDILKPDIQRTGELRKNSFSRHWKPNKKSIFRSIPIFSEQALHWRRWSKNKMFICCVTQLLRKLSEKVWCSQFEQNNSTMAGSGYINRRWNSNFRDIQQARYLHRLLVKHGISPQLRKCAYLHVGNIRVFKYFKK
jgi:hypothetical protein